MQRGKAFEEYWDLLKEVLREHVEVDRVQYTRHAEDRMAERDIPKKVVQTILKTKRPVEMYEPHAYPHGERPYTNAHPVFTLVNDEVAVGLAMERQHGQKIHFVVLTVKSTTHTRFRSL